MGVYATIRLRLMSWWYGDSDEPDDDWRPDIGCLILVTWSVLFCAGLIVLAWWLRRVLR